MLSNCVKHELVVAGDFFTTGNERFRQIEIKTGSNYGEDMIPVNISVVCNHCKNLLEEMYRSAILFRVF